MPAINQEDIRDFLRDEYSMPTNGATDFEDLVKRFVNDYASEFALYSEGKFHFYNSDEMIAFKMKFCKS